MSDKFYKIAQKAIEEAEGVDCSLSEFAEGIGEMIEELQMRKEMVDMELGDECAAASA